MSKVDNNLTEKLQVLLSPKDVKELYKVISRKSLDTGKRPPPISSYIRDLIKDHIEKETLEQKSFAKEQAKKIIQEHEANKKKKETKN